MRHRKTGNAIVRMLLLATWLASAASFAESPPVVVELFTSQGCNSCPPADALLGELANRSDVVALAFHVDYWDGLGWHDRFALPEAVQRQRRYAATLPHAGVFTPQVVVGGRSSLLGTDRRGIVARIGTSSDAAPITLAVDATDLKVALGTRPKASPYDVNLVAFVGAASTPIGRGENAGRTLKEFNIVRAFRRLGAWDGAPNTFDVALASLPADADQAAVFIQRAGQGAIAGAARIDLR
jgi:hypothetical protein